MKQTLLFLALASGLLVSACGGDSKFPVATGKASITAINAIVASPNLNFLIEERSIGQVAYQATTTTSSWDDLEFTFSFDAIFAGATEVTRIASQRIDFVAGQRYTVVATGTVAAPTLTVWETPERIFEATETTFQVRFSHTSASLSTGAIDIYLALDGVAPVLGQAAATVAYRDISPAMDFESGEYVAIITSSGNPTDVLFTSRPTTVLARTDMVVTPFDGDANNTTSIVVRGLGTLGGSIPFHEPLALSTIQFLHAAMEMGTTDVFDDAALSSQILTNHAYRDLTADTSIAAGTYQYLYTPTGGISAVALDTQFFAGEGLHYRVAAVGSGGVYSTINTILDRRSISTGAKLLYFQSTNNFEFTDLYAVDAGTSITDQFPIRPGVASRIPIAPIELAPGSYDLYVTDFLDKGILAGPTRLDVVLGDVVDMVVFDTVDPAVLETVVFPIP